MNAKAITRRDTHRAYRAACRDLYFARLDIRTLESELATVTRTYRAMIRKLESRVAATRRRALELQTELGITGEPSYDPGMAWFDHYERQ